jgi:hypothetical protein
MSQNVQPVPKSGSKNLLIVLLVVIVLAIVGVTAYLLLGSGPSLIGGNLLGGGEVPQAQFVVGMNKLVLRPQDLSVAYNIVPGGNLNMSNAQLSNNLGAAFGKPFILNTGRVDGWDLAMERVNPDDFAPEYIRSRVEIYQDASGAADSLSEDWFWAYQLEERAPDQFLDKSCNVGTDCVTFMYTEVKPGSGSIVERYDAALRYKNVTVWVMIKGQQGEVSEDLVLNYAQMVLDKVKTVQ